MLKPHPQPRTQRKKAYERSHHRLAETIRHSLHDGFTVSFVISSVSRAFCHRRLSRSSPRRLDISVGISGPHDFAVRPHAVRLAAQRRPSHPAPYVRDDREAPLFVGRGTGRAYRDDLPDGLSEIFFVSGLDSRLSVDRAGEFRFLAQSFFRHPGARAERASPEFIVPQECRDERISGSRVPRAPK